MKFHCRNPIAFQVILITTQHCRLPLHNYIKTRSGQKWQSGRLGQGHLLYCTYLFDFDSIFSTKNAKIIKKNKNLNPLKCMDVLFHKYTYKINYCMVNTFFLIVKDSNSFIQECCSHKLQGYSAWMAWILFESGKECSVLKIRKSSI